MVNGKNHKNSWILSLSQMLHKDLKIMQMQLKQVIISCLIATKAENSIMTPRMFLTLIICLWVQWTRQDFKSCYFQNNSTDFIDILWLCYKTKYTTPDKVSENLAVYEESYQKFSIWVHWTRMSFLHREIFWKVSILKLKCGNALQDVHCDVIDR